MRLAAAARLLAFVSAAFVCTNATVDPDLWGHVRFGLDTLRDRRLASIDPYSFTQDIPWVNHEWLSEVAQAVAYRAAGVFGLIALKTILLGAAVALLALGIRRAVEPYRWLLLAAGIVSLVPAYTMRPQLWTFLGIPVLWWALQERRRLVWIPAIFALWVNLHGGWIVGIGVASLWLAGRFVDGRADHSDRPLRETAADLVPTAVAIAAGVAATLINPYGWRMWMFLLSTVRVTRNITEWRPLWQQESVWPAVLWLLVAAVIVVPTLIRRRRSISWAGALPAAWLGVMSAFVARLLPIFGEVAVLGLAQAWTVRLKADTIVDGASGEVRLKPDAPAARQFLIIDAIVAAVIVLANVIPQSRCLAIEGTWTPDLVAAGVFQTPSVGGRLVLPFDWGQYAIWHWGPRLRVSIDGRRETVYSENTLRVQAAVADALPEGIAFLERERPEYVWLQTRRSGALASWLAANGYRLDVQTAQSFVATRADLPPLRVGTPMPRCFP